MGIARVFIGAAVSGWIFTAHNWLHWHALDIGSPRPRLLSVMLTFTSVGVSVMTVRVQSPPQLSTIDAIDDVGSDLASRVNMTHGKAC